MQTSCAVNPLELEILDAFGYTTGQLYTDAGHVDEIAADLAHPSSSSATTPTPTPAPTDSTPPTSPRSPQWS